MRTLGCKIPKLPTEGGGEEGGRRGGEKRGGEEGGRRGENGVLGVVKKNIRIR